MGLRRNHTTQQSIVDSRRRATNSRAAKSGAAANPAVKESQPLQ